MKLVLAILVATLVSICIGAYTPPVKAGVFLTEVMCGLDPRINATTLSGYKNGTYLQQIAQYFWATACGRSRGVFTLDGTLYKGHTYSCAHWPEEWGIASISDWFATPDVYAQHLKYFDLYIQGNFNTTAVHGPATCDFATFSIYSCGEAREAPWKKAPWVTKIGNKPFRGVNLGGLFVLEPWITPKFTEWTLALPDQYTFSQLNPKGSAGFKKLSDHWNLWYTNDDFAQMKSIGLNAIRLPLGWWYFGDTAGVARTPYTVPDQDITDAAHPITKIIQLAYNNGLVVILDLHGAPGSQNGLDNSGRRSSDPMPERWGFEWAYDPDMLAATTKILVAMAKYAAHLQTLKLDNVVAIELLNEPWVFGDMAVVRDFYVTAIEAIRVVSDIPLIIHDAFRHEEWDWLLIDFPYKNIFMDTHIYHAFNSDDQASSEPICDHNKMIVAENIACGYGSMLRFKTCIGVPTYVGEWSLAIDDCIAIIRGAGSSVQTRDFGQCNHLKERLGDPWWREQYQKFAYKQMAMAERELGWFFWTWKTNGTQDDPSEPYWNFQRAVKENILPPNLDHAGMNITTACWEFESTEPYTC